MTRDRSGYTLLASARWINNLSNRTRNCLHKAGIETVEQLQQTGREQLLAIDGFGEGCLYEVQRFLRMQNIPEAPLTTEMGETPGGAREVIETNDFLTMLSTRTRRLLAAKRISTLEQLRMTDSEALMSITGFGERCLAEVDNFLEANSLTRPRAFVPLRPHDSASAAPRDITYLSERTREFLQAAGIFETDDIFESSLSTLLQATGYDAVVTDEICVRCGVPQPRDEQEFLALLASSAVTRQQLFSSREPLIDEALDHVGCCLREAEEQIERGYLHKAAVMDFMPVQSMNSGLRPPTRDLSAFLQTICRIESFIRLPAIGMVADALQVSTVEQEIESLFGLLEAREVEVIRRRYALNHSTLEQLTVDFDVTRERIRQVQLEATRRIKKAYYWELPLLRIRTAMRLVRESAAFSMQEILELLGERGLASSEQTVSDLVAVWRALEPGPSDLTDDLLWWHAIEPDAYIFPSEILSVAKTGLSPKQQVISKEVDRLARRRVSRVGAVSLERIMRSLSFDEVPVRSDVEAVLRQHGYREPVPGYWVGGTATYSIPHAVASKMLAVCGPLTVRQVRRGLMRHQQRLGYQVPKVHVLFAVLADHEPFEVREDGIVSLKRPDEVSPSLGASERVWLQTAAKHGPVVHSSTLVQAFARNGLQSVTAYRLMQGSALVEKVGKQLFCLPGANVSTADRENGLRQAVQRREDLDTELPEILTAHLRFDAGSRRLLLVIPSTSWPGEVSVRLLWEGADNILPTSYVSDEETTVVDPIERELRSSSWEREALLITDHSRCVVTLPAPRDRALVFRPSGARVARWSPGESYYIVIPESRFVRSEAEVVFEEWHRIGTPKGWHDHALLWVRTKDPLAHQSVSERAGEAESTIDQFQRAARTLSLPDFEHLWHPTGRLIGGSRATSSKNENVFFADAPPLLEVKGLWDSVLHVALTRWKPEAAGFVTVDSLRLPPSRGGVQIHLLWEEEERPAKGLYRVEIDTETAVEFDLVDASPSPELPALDLRLETELHGWEEMLENLPRSELERATLVGHAWPGARLRLRVSCGAWSRSLEVSADTSGVWRARWRDLGLTEVPRGTLEVVLSWKDLISSRLVFADGPYVAEDDVRLAWRQEGSSRHLELAGRASNVSPGQRVQATLLGPRPWAGEIWTEGFEVSEDGTFEAWFSTTNEVHWLIIIPEGEPCESAPWLVQAQTEDYPDDSYPIVDLYHGDERTWDDLRIILRDAPLPPGLRRLLNLSALGRLLEDIVAFQSLEAKWLPAGRSTGLQHLASWTPFGLRVPVAVFATAPASIDQYTANESLHLLEVGAEELLEAKRYGRTELALRCLQPDGGRRRVSSFLLLNEGEEETNYELKAEEMLYACPRCGLILPPGESENHSPPSPAFRRCSEAGRAFTMVHKGRRRSVEVYARLEPQMVLKSIEELVRRVAEGDESDVPGHAESWLDRLYGAYAEEAEDEDPSAWVSLLNQLLESLRFLKERTEADELWLADLGRSVGHYESGLRVMNEWTRSEVG